MSGELMIRKIIIVNRTEKSSLEVPLTKGLNIILGANKTGKSSIIKTIFYSLGCELKFDSDWENMNKRAIICFSVDDSYYLVERENNEFVLYSCAANLEKIKFIGTFTYTEFSAKFLELFDIHVTWTTKNGEDKPVAPPYLFSFNYIDQDKGWSSIAKSFERLSYISNWEKQIIKYVVGYQNEEYFKLRRDLDQYRIHIKQIELKIKTLDEFVTNIIARENNGELVPNESGEILKNDLEKCKNILEELSALERVQIEINESITELQNEEYEKKLLINALSKYSSDLEADHAFASGLDDRITCPFCGIIHSNDITEKSELIKDIQMATNIVATSHKELEEIRKNLAHLKESESGIRGKHRTLRGALSKIQSTTNALETIKTEGKNDLIKTGLLEIEDIKDQKNKYLGLKDETQGKINEIESVTRRNKISKEINTRMRILLDRLGLSEINVKLSGFLPSLKHTGSELPRVIYAYYISLFLFNLERNDYPFKWLVIDTPNQQGQDEINLSNIYTTLEVLLSAKGQVIIGTERLTGKENEAANVVKLTHYKKCLNTDNYDEHVQLLSWLDNIKGNYLLNPLD